MRKKLAQKLRKLADELAAEQRQAAAVEAELEKLPPNLRPLGGAVSALLSVFGPPEFRAGARRVMLERTYSSVRAHVNRRQIRRVK